MKLVGIISTTVLFLLLGSTTPAYAQHEEHAQEPKPAEHVQGKQEAQQAKSSQHAAQKQESRQAKSSQHAEQKQEGRQAKSSQHAEQKQEGREAKSSQRAEQKQEGRQVKSEQQAERKQEGRHVKSSQSAQRMEHAQRQEYAQQSQGGGGDRGGRIPEDRFRAHFGRDHSFRINRPTMVAGHRRFRYGGYWFGFVDPWPVGWYYTDEVYVDYFDGGYYLYNRVHPGIRISIHVVV